MVDASIRDRVADYYSEKVRQHGETARGVDWNSTESQETRFGQLLRIVPAGATEYSILDYGCGYSALIDVLIERGETFRYTGYDVSEEMIQRARRLHPWDQCEFTTNEGALRPSDYVVASGVLNVRLDASNAEWSQYVLETLDDLHRLSLKGFAFNSLTSYSDPEYMRDHLFYSDPRWLFDHCKRSYSGQVALLHDYGLYEFTNPGEKESAMSKVVIFGIGDFAQVADVYLTEDSPHEVVAFTVNQEYIEATELSGHPVVAFEGLEELYPPSDFAMLVAIGFSGVNRTRAGICLQCKDRGYELISYVCSKATTWSDLDVGENTFVFEDNVIQPFVKIGNNVVLWSGNHIGHHVVIGDHCFIASHVVISGGTVIGDSCFLGVNSTIRDHITIAPFTVIGAGAIIMKDTEVEDVYIASKTNKAERKSSELNL